MLPADQATLDRAFATDGPAIPVGAPLGMDELEVGVDFERLFERSAGVFGKSGTGKSVLVLHLLDAMLTRSSAAPTNSDRTVALIFDMHNDYGWEMKFQGPTTSRLRSLKQRHQTEAELYTLESRVARSDGQILIGTRDIEPDDLEVLRETLDLSDLAIDAAHACRRRFGPGWIDELLADEPSAALVNKLWREPPEGDVNWSQVGAQMGYPGSLESLRRRMERLTRREFVRTTAPSSATSSSTSSAPCRAERASSSSSDATATTSPATCSSPTCSPAESGSGTGTAPSAPATRKRPTASSS